MTLTSVHFGRGVGLVSETTLAVLDPMNTELAQALWQLVGDGAGIDELLERLSTTGLRALGSFAMVQFEGDGVRVVVRGDAGAVIGAGTGSRVIVAHSVRTWHEEVVPDTSAVQLHLGQPVAEGERLPFHVTGGLIPADALLRGHLGGTELRSSDAEAPEGIAEVLTIDEPPASPRVPTAPSDPAPTPPDPAMTRMVEDVLAVSAPESAAPEPEVAEGLSAAPSTGTAPPAAGDEVEVDDYDQIWGRTMARSVQAAAVHQAPEADPHQPAEAPAAGPPAAPSVPARPAPAAGSTTAPPPPESEAPLIHSVPGAGQPPVTPVPPTVAPSPPSAGQALGDHDGRTMTKAQIQAMRAAAAAGGAGAGPSGPTMGGPTVQAMVCPGQHANPPHLSRCRVCGQALSGNVVVIARPTLGVLRFSNGTAAQLDKPALIGRNPKLEGVLQSEVPSVVRLDVGQGLSRTHASVRLEGWQVLLEDLNSANGTIVQLPGREARRLHPGEPVLLEHGATIDFGGEITCVVELT